MKKTLDQEKGVSLITLAATIIVIGILTTILVYNVKDTRDINNLTNLYSDINNLRSKVSNYYATYGKIPAIDEYSDLNTNDDNDIVKSLKDSEETPIGPNDTGNFLVIDLNALENLTLNYGKDFEKIKNATEIGNTNTDIYIINENSHNIFYLKGITVEGKKYYTNQDKDSEKVDLRYVNGVKIYDGYEYVSGKKDDKTDAIIIKNKENETIKYKWINIEDKFYSITEESNEIKLYDADDNTIVKTLTLNISQNSQNLYNSIDIFGGFYIIDSTSGPFSVLYNEANEDNSWTKEYDSEALYRDKNGDTAYIPKGFQVSKLHTLNTIKKGLVIQNSKTKDQFVWVSVPAKALEDANGNKPGDTNYTGTIESNLIRYVGQFHSSDYEDSWYDGCGMTQTEYNTQKDKLYASIQNKGGFWISRYEIRDEEHDLSSNNRTSGEDGKPISKSGYKVYNYISYNKALEEANIMSGQDYMKLDENITSSLLFGIQWDLTCKFISENATQLEPVQDIFLNIYDFSENVQEYTLENEVVSTAVSTENNSVIRGGLGTESTKIEKMKRRSVNEHNVNMENAGFRTTLY